MLVACRFVSPSRRHILVYGLLNLITGVKLRMRFCWLICALCMCHLCQVKRVMQRRRIRRAALVRMTCCMQLICWLQGRQLAPVQTNRPRQPASRTLQPSLQLPRCLQTCRSLSSSPVGIVVFFFVATPCFFLSCVIWCEYEILHAHWLRLVETCVKYSRHMYK